MAKLSFIRINALDLHVNSKIMNTKLTLSLNKDIIQQAKTYAKKHNISLSFLIENYLQKIIGEYQGNASEEYNIL